ncbi:MAG: hypothetical protein ACK4JE_03070 [Endomicrobiia bacterium]
MPQLRQNIAPKEWVIIATERAKRPEDFTKKEKNIQEPLPEYSPKCHFCPGNEQFAPVETFSIRKNNQWVVRVVPNKFPALIPKGDVSFHHEGIKHSMNGVGIHEVIIETPKHNLLLSLMSYEQVINIVSTYKNWMT